ncbi:hypothetical protein J4E91_005390 [Alternaria rosae]|nr:hypothetical protein J4E91_005390 [Alternaria rosae]
MRLSSLSTALLAFASAAQSLAVERRDLLSDLQNQALENLKAAEKNGTLEKRGSCSIFNASVRKDWAIMSAKERKAYISAVQCMFDAPSQSDPALVPGAKTRYDDFVAQHINQTLAIHGTGNFLSWHRYFVHGYETALREECGYKGYQPYWDWFAHTDDLTKHPVFDGSATSMGGDGEYVKHNGSAGGKGTIALPSGAGGGCIKDGPFKNLQINLGPISPAMAGEVPVKSPLEWNPRCAKRDLTSYASSTWMTFENLYNVTLGTASKNVGRFQDELQGRFPDGFLGMHGAGHFAIGGDGGDVFSSPNDPAFFLHHAMVDRVWWIWQALHLDQAKSVAGTITIFNQPPSRDARLDDPIQMNYLNLEPTTIEDMMSTLDGEPLECQANAKTGVVAGHYMFWQVEDRNGPKGVGTEKDWATHTHIIYLMVDPEIVTTRNKEDKTRERKQLPIERLQKWQEAEMMELRAVCRDYGMIFTTITETPTTTLGRAGERLATLLNNFHSHDEASNNAAVEQAVDTALNGQEDLDTVLLLNADKALAPHDTKLMFWKGITLSGGSIEFLKRNNLTHTKVIGGGLISDGYVVTGQSKGAVVDHIHKKKLHPPAKLLITPTRDAGNQSHSLRKAHERVGYHLATSYLSTITGLEEISLPHLQGGVTEGYRFRHEKATPTIPLMRGGERMALGVSKALPGAAFAHAKKLYDINTKNFEGKRTIIPVDSVINAGKQVDCGVWLFGTTELD